MTCINGLPPYNPQRPMVDQLMEQIQHLELQNQELQKQVEQWKASACSKKAPCGHCNCFQDIDYDFPGCSWCAVTKDNTECNEGWVADREKLATANRLYNEERKKNHHFERIVSAVLAWEACGYGPEVLGRRLEDAIADYRQQTERPKGEVARNPSAGQLTCGCNTLIACKEHRTEKRVDPPQIEVASCHKCGHKNTADDMRVLYTVGKVSTCGLCCPTSR